MAALEGDQKKDAQLIGQFGVGFYSGFIVADRIDGRIAPRRPAGRRRRALELAKAPATSRWKRSRAPQRGTNVILHLREGEEEFLSHWKLQVHHLEVLRPHLAAHPDAEGRVGRREASKQVTTDEWEPVNKAAALWARPKSDITTEQYEEFYKQISYDTEAPLAYTHNRVEGRSEYTQLLYIPAKAPFDLWNRDKRGGVKLYVKRVFIMDDAEALMPVYLRFVKGVIDSADLPLNVSRELLQESRDVKAIREGSTKRVLVDAGRPGRQRGRGREGQVRRVLERVRRGAEGRHRRRPRQPGAPGQAATASRRRTPTSGRRASRSPTTSRA